MLTISDLHQEQELSSFETRNVIGGEDAVGSDTAKAAAAVGNMFSTMGCSDAAQIMFAAADCANQWSYYRCPGW